jgi:hypothetical protein
MRHLVRRRVRALMRDDAGVTGNFRNLRSYAAFGNTSVRVAAEAESTLRKRERGGGPPPKGNRKVRVKQEWRAITGVLATSIDDGALPWRTRTRPMEEFAPFSRREAACGRSSSSPSTLRDHGFFHRFSSRPSRAAGICAVALGDGNAVEPAGFPVARQRVGTTDTAFRAAGRWFESSLARMLKWSPHQTCGGGFCVSGRSGAAGTRAG